MLAPGWLKGGKTNSFSGTLEKKKYIQNLPND